MTKSFADLFLKIEEAVEECLYRSLLLPKSKEFLDVDDHYGINKHFAFLVSNRADSVNGYLTRAVSGKYYGLVVGSGPQVTDRETRISQIVSAYLKSSRPGITTRRLSSKDAKDEQSVISCVAHFASPQVVTHRILTDPEAIETKEISRFFGKLRLLEESAVQVDLQHATDTSPDDNGNDSTIKFSDLDGFYSTFQRFVAGRDPYSNFSNRKTRFLLRYSASLGYLSLRLAIGEKRVATKKVEEVLVKAKEDEEFFLNHSFSDFRNILANQVEYTKNKSYDTLPTLAEISNRVFGIPVALSGFTELLRGGLKQGAGEGTVSLIRGGAGTGKTSLAISIQRAVEALGIPSVFVTSEETLTAIEARRESVLSLSQKSHSQFTNSVHSYKLLRAPSGKLQEPAESNFGEEVDEQNPLFEVLDGIIDGISETEDWPSAASVFSKLFVVFDGVHNFLRDDQSKDDYDILKKFVEKCRETGVQVLLTSSRDWMLDEGFEYLVDNYFLLDSKMEEDPVPYSERKFEVVKTRHQGSMVGKHRMTIGDEGDLQFQPNFSELLKSQARRSISETNNSVYSFPFAESESDRYFQERTSLNVLQSIRHYKNCSTLLYGVGSASKTDLAMRMLASPTVNEKPRPKKILVLSFLSSSKYYESCAKRHNRSLKDRGFEGWSVEVDCLYFSPGMISAEEVYFSISARIDNSETTLNAYDGILLDGVHNVFVQFPRLMGKPELWTSLTGMFRRCSVDFVVTYSDFDISPAAMLDSSAFSSDRATPLMVSLTQTLDYGYNLVPRYLAERERKKRMGQQGAFVYTPGSFELSCFIAHGQQVSGEEYLIWNKETKTLTTSEEP